MITRLQAPINKATSLTTENVNVQQAGDDVLVEQLSTLVDGDRTHVSMVCHIFYGGRWRHHRHAGLPQRAREPCLLEPGHPLMARGSWRS